MKTLLSLTEALQYAQEYEAQSRYAEAETLYRRLLEVGVSGSINGQPAALVLYECVVRSAANQGRHEAAMEAFERLLPLLQEPRDALYDSIYRRGLVLTRSHPLPLKRMYRFFELAKLLRATRGVEGDVAECGCYRGLSSYIIASHLRLEDARLSSDGFHIFDSFAGLSEPGAHDTVPEGDGSASADAIRFMMRAGHFAASLKEVKAALVEFPKIHFHPGWIPQSFAGEPERRYRLVHADVDLYAPTLGALEYFYPRLARDGRIVSDDYGWPGARRAIDEYVQRSGALLQVNAHHQAVIERPR